MIQLGATEATAVSFAVQIANSMTLTLDQMKEGARLLVDHTAKQNHYTVTAETTVTLGQYRQQACLHIRHRALDQM